MRSLRSQSPVVSVHFCRATRQKNTSDSICKKRRRETQRPAGRAGSQPLPRAAPSPAEGHPRHHSSRKVLFLLALIWHPKVSSRPCWHLLRGAATDHGGTEQRESRQQAGDVPITEGPWGWLEDVQLVNEHSSAKPCLQSVINCHKTSSSAHV